MKWSAETISPKPMRFVIEQQELKSLISGVPDQWGFYIYVYEDNHIIHDDLQDTLDHAKRFCLRKFGTPLDAWKQNEDEDKAPM